MTNILVIDSERSIRNSLKERLEYEGYHVDTAENGDEAVSKHEHRPYDLVLCDLNTPEQGALNLLASMRGGCRELPFIILSAMKSIDKAVECVRGGACDYILKPIDLNKLLGAIRSSQEDKDQNHATPGATAESGNISPLPPKTPRTVRNHGPHTEEIIGDSKGITHVKRLIDKVAPSDARVLITGSNGTGKELVARRLHEKSARAAGPFIEVNCAAIPSELIESELFGHEKGAFTSAIKQRKGKFEQADGGTLFLDEIGDMSLSAQAKVLRALQENRISRVGSDKDIEVNVRIIAATNKDLQHEIEAGNFREDLYHRLSVIIIRIPTLHERAEDIPALIGHFIETICREYGTEPKKIEPEAVGELMRMKWSGNIRELRNVVERLIILSGPEITLEDVETYAVGAV